MDRDGRSEAQYAAAVDLAIRGITLQDDSDYARKSDLDGFALLSDIPPPPNLAPFALKSSIPSIAGLAKTTEVNAALEGMLSSEAPKSEAKLAAAGKAMKATREDHQHPRLSSTTGLHTTNASGVATVMFTRDFPPVVNATFPTGTVPGIACFAVEDNTLPTPSFKGMRFLKADGSTWTSSADGNIAGVVLFASRPNNLPILTSVSGILTAVINGVNAIVTALSGIPTSVPAPGVKFTCIALQTSAT